MIKDKKQFFSLLLIFTLSIMCLMLYIYKIKHTLYISSPDGKLYLSIADWEKRLTLLIPVLFIGYLIRPVLSVLWILSMIMMIIMTIVHKFNWKKAAILIILPVLILTINVFVNYRETGDIVLIENYSGIAVYQANNINTKVSQYNYYEANSFYDDYFIKINFSKDLTMTEKNRLLKEQAKEFISQNLGFVLKNTVIKYYYLFIKSYRYSIFIFMAGILYFSIYDRRKRTIYILFLISFMLLSILTSMGLNISRYSIIALPFYSIINAGVIALIINSTYKFIINKFIKSKQTV